MNPTLTPAEYLAFERQQTDAKHEYWKGQITAMRGGSREHNLIVGNAFASLHGQLRGRGCEVYSNDMRVHIPATGLYTYPDIAALCGEPVFEGDQFDTLLNPHVIIEVLSSSTEAYDRGAKFAHYRSIESLQAYVLIAQDRPHIELFERGTDGRWVLSEAKGAELLAHINDRLPKKRREAPSFRAGRTSTDQEADRVELLCWSLALLPAANNLTQQRHESIGLLLMLAAVVSRSSLV